MLFYEDLKWNKEGAVESQRDREPLSFPTAL